MTLRNLISSGRRATITGLARLLHVTPQAASEMVHRLIAEGLVEQGAISEHVGASLDVFLGHPETCPHGNPIDAAAALRRPAGVPMNSLASGERGTIYRITDTEFDVIRQVGLFQPHADVIDLAGLQFERDQPLLSYLEARGLRPGAAIAVQSSSEALDTISLEGPRGAATLGFRPAALVLVLPGTADPALFHHIPVRATHLEAR